MNASWSRTRIELGSRPPRPAPQFSAPNPAAEGPFLNATVLYAGHATKLPPRAAVEAAMIAVETDRMRLSELSPTSQVKHQRALAHLRELLSTSQDLSVHAMLEIESMQRRGDDWFTAETRRRDVAAFGAKLSKVWNADPYRAALAHEFGIEFVSRASLAACHSPDDAGEIIGLARVDENRMLVADNLSASLERETVAHELAHLLLVCACSGRPSGEEAARSFAEAFCTGFAA